MKILVTGATGLIGSQLSLKLADRRGHEVHALYRSKEKTKDLNHPNINLFKGDILDVQSLEKAVEGCHAVFHLAAFAKVWAKDPKLFHQINVQGTINVLHAAKKMRVKRFILTSTAGVFGPSLDGVVTEKTVRSTPFFTAYEETKALSEKKALEAATSEFEIVIVNPTRVYGPGLLSESNGVTRLVKLYLENKFGLIPGNGKCIGNYVFMDDVVHGHLLALEKGKPNENYLLGGDNVTFNELYKQIAHIQKRNKPLIHISLWILLIIAGVFELRAFLFGTAPLITPKWVKRYLHDWEVSSQKAINDLGYKITPITTGLEKTIDWLITGKKA